MFETIFEIINNPPVLNLFGYLFGPSKKNNIFLNKLKINFGFSSEKELMYVLCNFEIEYEMKFDCCESKI